MAKKQEKIYHRNYRKLHKGYDDNLEPLQPLDLSKIKNFSDMATAMSKTAFGGRLVGEAVETLVRMARDKDTFVVLTVSGAMTVAKMGLLICDMIDRGLVHAVISTGALMAHGLSEAAGMAHFKAPRHMDDVKMYKAGYDRVYDTVELEKNLDKIEKIIFQVLSKIPNDRTLSSRLINEQIGRWLVANTPHRGILKSAYLKGVPVYVPAFSDSELALDLGLFNRWMLKTGRRVRRFDPMIDLEHYASLIWKQKKNGIFTVGGGVPRNWAQQAGPYVDLVSQKKFNNQVDIGIGSRDFKPVMFSYGLRICPEPVHLGGLSGCTYSEGVSWGKFIPEELGGRFTEVLSDATVVWPFILKAAFERLGKRVIKKDIYSGKKAIREVEEAVEKNYNFAL